jgi:hypothetical protein
MGICPRGHNGQSPAIKRIATRSLSESEAFGLVLLGRDAQIDFSSSHCLTTEHDIFETQCYHNDSSELLVTTICPDKAIYLPLKFLGVQLHIPNVHSKGDVPLFGGHCFSHVVSESGRST